MAATCVHGVLSGAEAIGDNSPWAGAVVSPAKRTKLQLALCRPNSISFAALASPQRRSRPFQRIPLSPMSRKTHSDALGVGVAGAQSALNLKEALALVHRLAVVTGSAMWAGVQHACDTCVEKVSGDSEASEFDSKVTDLVERLGGGLPKLCQIASTRSDLFSDRVCHSLSRLQDRCAPVEPHLIRRAIERNYGGFPFDSFDFEPVGSATVAQVHRARRRDDGREVAVKVMRPGIRRYLARDCSVLKLGAKALDTVPMLRALPVRQGVMDATTMLMQQTHFAQETANLTRLSAMFRGTRIIMPSPHADLCRDSVVCMDYISNLKRFDHPDVTEKEARDGIKIAARALFRMIFQEGFFHCDMHPGNVFLAPGNRVVLLDAGLVAEMEPEVRKAFVRFYLALWKRDGRAAAKILRETAEAFNVAMPVKGFDEEFTRFVTQRQTAGIVPFVRKLMAIQRRYGVRITSKFTTAFLAMALFDGTARQRIPGYNINAEALPIAQATDC